MAKKKLNKKVAIIGSFLLVLICLAGIIIVLNTINRDPEIFIKDAEAFLSDAEQLASETLAQGNYTDEEVDKVKGLYLKAAQNYSKAANFEKDSAKKVDLFFTLVDIHLISNEFHPADWVNAKRCWGIILNLDPHNVDVRREILDSTYKPASAMASMGIINPGMWDRVKTGSEELIEAIENNGDEPDSYVLLAYGRSLTEVANAGQDNKSEQMISDAMLNLNKAIERSPDNTDSYQALGRAEFVKGQIENAIGVADAVIEAKKLEESHLLKAIEAVPESAKARVNLYTFYFREAKAKLARSTEKDSHDAALAEITALESEYNELRKQKPFSTTGEIHAATVKLFRSQGTESVSQAAKTDSFIWALEDAITYDNENIHHYLQCANLYFFKGSSSNDMDSINRAIELCKHAINLPGAEKVSGPMSDLNRHNRQGIYSLLSMCYFNQIFENPDGDNQELISLAEESVLNFIENFGSETGPTILKWQGILNYAKGNEDEALRQMYGSYTTLKTTDKRDAYLSFVLSEALKGKSEIGLRLEFLRTALEQGISGQKPEALLEYSEVLHSLREAEGSLQVIENYEKTYGQSHRSKLLKARVYITSGMYDEAEAIIDTLDASHTDTIRIKLNMLHVKFSRLQATQMPEGTSAEELKQRDDELAVIRAERIAMYKQLISVDPDKTSPPMSICSDLVKTGTIDSIKEIMDVYLASHKDNVQWLINRKMLDEPDYKDISEERSTEIALEVINGLTDEINRHIQLGLHYQAMGESEKATEEFKAAYKLSPSDKLSASILFEDALSREDFTLALEISEAAAKLSLDGCEGNFFFGRLSMAKEDYDEAKSRLEKSLELKPISPMSYVLLSQIDAILKNYEDSIDNISKASRMVPLDAMVAKHKILVIKQRNDALESNITVLQQEELERAYVLASTLDPQDMLLQSNYVEYISNRKPKYAILIQQGIVKKIPNAQNYFQLGKIALYTGIKEPLESEKQSLLKIAGDALSQSFKLAPDNPNVKKIYSEYLRITNQADKVAELFVNDKTTMWSFYIKNGQYDKAQEILTELYSADPKDRSIIYGLIQVSEMTGSITDAVRYSNELLSIEATTDNELAQIELLLRLHQLEEAKDLNLLEEAEVKLASFNDRHPDDSRALLLEAWVTMIKDQNIEALDIINRNLAINPENATAWRLRGQINIRLNNLSQAVSDLQESKKINPNPSIQLDLARAYVHAGRNQEAIGELMTAIQDGRTPLTARLMLESLYSDAEQLSNLESLYAETTEKYPESTFWHYRAGQLSLRLGKDDQAEKYFSAAMKCSEKDGNRDSGLVIFDGYLTSLRSSNQYDKLIEEAGKHLSDDYATVSYNQMAVAEKLIKNNGAKSNEYFLTALDKAGSNDEYLTKILTSMRQYIGDDEVAKWCTSKLSESPNNRPALIMMYDISLSQEKFSEGLGYIDRAIEPASKKDLTQVDNLGEWVQYVGLKAQLLLSAYLKTGERPYLLDSIEHHEIILENVPEGSKAKYNVMNNLAYLLADNNEQLVKAKEYAKQVCESSPNDANKMDTYAYVLCKLKDYVKAEEISENAIEILNRNSIAVDWNIYEHLGMSQEGLGKNPEAKTSYQKSLEAAQETASEKDLNELKEAIKRVS